MDNYMSVLLILLYVDAWYLVITYKLTHASWHKTKKFNIKSSGKHFIISIVVFFILIAMIMPRIDRMYHPEKYHKKHQSENTFVEEE